MGVLFLFFLEDLLEVERGPFLCGCGAVELVKKCWRARAERPAPELLAMILNVAGVFMHVQVVKEKKVRFNFVNARPDELPFLTEYCRRNALQPLLLMNMIISLRVIIPMGRCSALTTTTERIPAVGARRVRE